MFYLRERRRELEDLDREVEKLALPGYPVLEKTYGPNDHGRLLSELLKPLGLVEVSDQRLRVRLLKACADASLEVCRELRATQDGGVTPSVEGCQAAPLVG
jgi:hypothetical protein